MKNREAMEVIQGVIVRENLARNLLSIILGTLQKEEWENLTQEQRNGYISSWLAHMDILKSIK